MSWTNNLWKKTTLCNSLFLEYRKSVTALNAKYVAQHNVLDFVPNSQMQNAMMLIGIPKIIKPRSTYWQCKLESIYKFAKAYKMRPIARTVLIMVIIRIIVGIIRMVPDHVLSKCCIGFQECRPIHIETLFGFTCYIRCFTQSKLRSHACRPCECAVIKRS